MINITYLDSMLESELRRKVEMNPYGAEGVVPLFGERTDNMARALYEEMCRHRGRNGYPIPGTFEEKREPAKWHLDIEAKLGALAAGRSNRGLVYEAGAGIAVPSIAYAMLTGKKAVVIEKEAVEIEHARETAEMLGVDSQLEFIADTAENVFQQRRINPEDVVIFAEPSGTLVKYWRQLLDEYSFTLILNEGLNLRVNGHLLARCLQDEMMTEWAEREFYSRGYVVEVSRSRFSDEDLVFVTTKP